MKILKSVFGVPLAAFGILVVFFMVWIGMTAFTGMFDNGYSFGSRTREQVAKGSCPNMPHAILNSSGNTLGLRMGDGTGDVWLSYTDSKSTSYWDMEEVPGDVCPKVTFLAEEFYTPHNSDEVLDEEDVVRDVEFKWDSKLFDCFSAKGGCTPAMMRVVNRDRSAAKPSRPQIKSICEVDQYEAGCPGRKTPP